ncbi:hypothetical protein BDZ91DRAFT_797478 [Kalaharituber pfeilii]|nr:hypothetical protein BDZ91DRAFT_797478 [Kalaharituber pfeilii]
MAVLTTLRGAATREEWEWRVADEEDKGWKAIYADGIGLPRGGRVGVGYWIAITEALGDEEEELLVITDSQVALNSMINSQVVLNSMIKLAKGRPTSDGASNMCRLALEERETRANGVAQLGMVPPYEDEPVTEGDNATKLGGKNKNEGQEEASQGKEQAGLNYRTLHETR